MSQFCVWEEKITHLTIIHCVPEIKYCAVQNSRSCFAFHRVLTAQLHTWHEGQDMDLLYSSCSGLKPKNQRSNSADAQCGCHTFLFLLYFVQSSNTASMVVTYNKLKSSFKWYSFVLNRFKMKAAATWARVKTYFGLLRQTILLYILQKPTRHFHIKGY